MGLWKTFTEFWRRKPETNNRSFAERLRRGFNAAEKNRLTADWPLFQTSTDADLYRSLKPLRNRSRDLSKNSPYARKFLEIATNNIIGPRGIRLQVRATRNTNDNPDKPLNDVIEMAWDEWGRKGTCDVTGQLSWLDAQRLAVRTLARDGEVLVRLVETSNPFGMQIQFIPVEWLDEAYNRIENGNRVIMSVEIDAFDRPVAYWLTPPASDAFPRMVSETKRTRVPASEILHIYLKNEANQTRGIPWMAPAMQYMRMLDGYIEAELTAARVAACKMAFYKEPVSDEYTGPEKERPELIQETSPGQFGILPEGYELVQFSPEHPVTAFKDFVSAALKGIASGLNVAHATLSSDLTEVNYGSIRAGLIEERDHWRSLQCFLQESFCQPVYERWLKSALLAGAIDIPPAKVAKASRPVWRARGFAWVDPEKDINATILAIQNGLKTRTDACAENGEDLEENLYQLAAEQQMIDSLGVKIGANPPTMAAAPPAQKDQQNKQLSSSLVI